MKEHTVEVENEDENSGAYYWVESTERERDVERMLRSEPGYRLAMGVDGAAGGSGILQRIASFIKGR